MECGGFQEGLFRCSHWVFEEAVRNKAKFAKGNQVHQGVGAMFVVIWRRVQQNLATQMGLLRPAGRKYMDDQCFFETPMLHSKSFRLWAVSICKWDWPVGLLFC